MNETRSQTLKKGDEYKIPSDWPPPNENDTENPESIVHALYEVISGAADESRDWQRFRSLCMSGAQFLITRWIDEGGDKEGIWEWDVEGFVAEAEEFYSKNGFWEREIRSRVERFGNVAHVFSTYESRINNPDDKPVVRGINSFQLVRYRGRWWIANVCWDIERPYNTIPPEYDDSVTS
jgi:hypothetical protein